MGISIRVGDEVQVRVSRRAERRINERRAAANKRAAATRGKVTSVDREGGRVVVEGHNFHIQHLKRSQKHPQGGRLERESWVPVARVMLVATDGKPVRLSDAERVDGKIVRKSASGGSGK